MRQHILPLAALVSLLLAPQVVAASPSFTATYNFYRNGMRLGETTTTMTIQSNRYVLVSTTQPVGLAKALLGKRGHFVVRSEGRVGARGLVPEKYSYLPGNDAGRTAYATFDWGKGRLINTYKDKHKEYKLQPGSQDKLSVLYHYMYAPRRAGLHEVPLASGKKYEMEALRLSGVGSSSVKLESLSDGPKDSRMVIWLDPARYHLPVRVVHEDPDDNERLEQVLITFKTHP